MLSRKNRIRMFIKDTPKSAIFSTILGVISALTFICGAVLSCVKRGDAGLELGIMGVSAMIVNVIGFALAIKSFKKDDVYYTLPVVSIVINGVLFILYMGFYLFGFLLNL